MRSSLTEAGACVLPPPFLAVACMELVQGECRGSLAKIGRVGLPMTTPLSPLSSPPAPACMPPASCCDAHTAWIIGNRALDVIASERSFEVLSHELSRAERGQSAGALKIKKSAFAPMARTSSRQIIHEIN
eukprot:6186274-Pleurochrysis_carterae.AAC.1